MSKPRGRQHDLPDLTIQPGELVEPMRPPRRGEGPGARRITKNLDLPQPRGDRPPWEVPTPVSLRREAMEKAQEQVQFRGRPVEDVQVPAVVADPRPAPGNRPLTPQELAEVQERSRAGLVQRRAHLNYTDDQKGRPCSCVVGMTTDQRCAAHQDLHGGNKWLWPRA